MRKLGHIQQQIRQLSWEELAELREWFLELDWTAWDAQIEADVKSGKLDKLIAESQEHFKAGS